MESRVAADKDLQCNGGQSYASNNNMKNTIIIYVDNEDIITAYYHTNRQIIY